MVNFYIRAYAKVAKLILTKLNHVTLKEGVVNKFSTNIKRRIFGYDKFTHCNYERKGGKLAIDTANERCSQSGAC